ncbi:hypothetical protein [Streptomyces sp. 891-h]|uniref:hypothetical protein n=1 Tax=unclassified Streptomyces TaxID=2593676 RepID=UPI001FA9F515|nr:hypothetical protein [Streptomyces sp. 891-h]UNZ18621.1 hypothetical protein HC362_17885 [Streptomyces sp. 891-h]
MTRKRISEATGARLELSAALKAAGVQFPAMDVQRRSTYGLIALGEIAPATAKALAEVIRRGAAR